MYARAPQRGLRVVAALCAVASLGALVGYVLLGIPMTFTLTFTGLPSILLLFTLAAFARRIDAGQFVHCLIAGAVGGFVATLAYDVSRWVIRVSGLLDYDGFKAIYIFGGWITGAPGTPAAALAGWIYHFWNGIGFGIFYALIVGRGTWLAGLLYGLVMEGMMLGLFPLFLTVTNRVDFILLSLIGHAIYGVVLGLYVRTYGRRWEKGPP
jgi:hypothetical protein